MRIAKHSRLRTFAKRVTLWVILPAAVVLNVRLAPVCVAVALFEIVMDVAEVIPVMNVFAGMPTPLTGIPTIIARLNVPYGENGGWPWMHLEQVLAGQKIAVSTDEPSVYNPIHEDDIIRMVPLLLDQATVPATIVNWGGNDAVSIEEWSQYMGDLVGKKAKFVQTDQALESVQVDLTKLHALVGPTEVHWKDGLRRMVAHYHPELALAD